MLMPGCEEPEETGVESGRYGAKSNESPDILAELSRLLRNAASLECDGVGDGGTEEEGGGVAPADDKAELLDG